MISRHGGTVSTCDARPGRRVRLYTPVGELLPGMAYLCPPLVENTSNESGLRKEYVESQPLSLLLSPPDSAVSPPRSSTPVEHKSCSASPGNFVNEPVADFSRESVRIAMTDAIDRRRNNWDNDSTCRRSRLICQQGLICRRMIPVGRISSSRWCRVISLPISRRLPRLPRPPKSPGSKRPVADRVAVMRQVLMQEQR